MSPTAARADTHEGSGERIDSELMYEIMIAEMAGRRGYLDVALSAYLRAAMRSDDHRVADRAARLASFGRQWPEAEEASRRWLALVPDSLEAHELLAQAQLRQKKTDAARTTLEKLVRVSSDRTTSLQVVQALLQRESAGPSALTIMRALAKRYPTEAEAELGIARLQLGQNNRDAALESVDRALTIDARNSDALLVRAQILSTLGRPAEGFDQLARALAEDPDNLDLRLGHAQLLVGAGRYEQASAELDRIFRRLESPDKDGSTASSDGDAATSESPAEDSGNNPGNDSGARIAGDRADKLLTISLLALDSRRIEQAETYLDALLATGAYPDQAHYYLARIHDQKQEYSDAIQFYDAVQGGELVLNSRIRAAELHGAIGELDLGRARLHELAESLPDPSLRPQLLSAESRMLQEVGRHEEAVTVLSDGLKEFPDNAELLYSRALAADNAGDPAMLESDLETIIAAEPDNANALNALGYYLADENIRLDEAARYLEKANRLKPNDAAIMDSLGWLRFRQGRHERAIELLRQAYALYPDGEIAAHLGEVLWVEGAENEAREVWREALAHSPDDDTLNRVVRKYVDDPAAIGAR